MPTFQPSQVIDRRGQNNNLNISGAILNPLAQGLGEGLTRLGKEAFDLYSPAERYQQSLIAANERALADKAASSLQEAMLNPDFAEKWKDPAFQQQWANINVGEGKAEAFLSGTVADSPLARQIRNTGMALDAGNEAPPSRPVPNLAGGATVGINPNAGGSDLSALTLTNAPPEVPKDSGPAVAPEPTGVQEQQSVKQQIQQGAQSVQSPLTSTALPELPGVAPVAPPSPQKVAETAQVEGLETPQPLDTQKLQDQVKAYMIRQQGRVGLYRQVLNAATTGKMDAEQTALGAALSGVHQAELTALMETVAPSMGLPLKDNQGNPIQGGALLDGQAYIFMTANPDAFAKMPAETQADMKASSRRFTTLISNMDAARAGKLQEMVDKFSKSKLASPEAWLTYANAEKNREIEIIKHRNAQALAERAQANDDKKLAMGLETQAIANQEQRLNLEILRQYKGPMAEAALQEAQQKVKESAQLYDLRTSKEERDNQTALYAALTAKAEIDAKKGVTRYNQTQFTQAFHAKSIAALNKTMEDYTTKMGTSLLPSQANMNRMKAEMKGDTSKVDQWMAAQPKDFQARFAAAGPAEKFEQYYIAVGNDSKYAEYATQMAEYRRQLANAEAALTASVGAPPPGMGSDPLTDSLQSMAQKTLEKQLKPILQAEAVEEFKGVDPSQWSEVLRTNPTAVNIILGKTLSRKPDDRGWGTKASQGLIRLVQGSVASGRKFDADSVANMPVAGGRKLKDVVGPSRMGNYYNSYVELLSKLGSIK